MQTNAGGAGPRGDYAVTVFKRFPPGNPIDWWHHFNHLCNESCDPGPTGPAKQEHYYGPFRLPALTFSGNRPGTTIPADGTRMADFENLVNWLPQHQMSLWQDGSSNQIIFGEKFIPLWGLGLGATPMFSWDGGGGSWDASYLFTWNEITHGSTRIVNAATGNPPIARSPDDSTVPENTGAHSAPNAYGTRYPFGSHHPKVCNFALGDGAVRSIMVSVPQTVIVNLCDVQDGNTVDLP